MSPSSTVSAQDLVEVPAAHQPPTISWGSVIAGMLTAIAVQIGLAELCLAAGLAMYSPFDPAAPNATVAIGTIIAWLISAIVALFLGGWVASRLAHYQSPTIAALHGILVWATGSVVAATLVATTLGVIAGGTFSLLGDGIAAAGNGVQAAGTGIAAIVAPNWDAIRDDVKEAGSKISAAAQTGSLAGGQADPAANPTATSQAGSQDNRLADKSRMMDLLGGYFTTSTTEGVSPVEKEELTLLLASQLGLSKDAAVKTLAQWQASWKATVARYDAAVERAKQETIAAKSYTASAAGAGFLLMFVGAAAAAFGGLTGSIRFGSDRLRADGRTGLRKPVPVTG